MPQRESGTQLHVHDAGPGLHSIVHPDSPLLLSAMDTADAAVSTTDRPVTPVTPPDAPRVLLSRTDILSTRDLRSEIVPTDEWRPGSAVRVVALYAEARDLLERFLEDQQERHVAENVRAYMCALCIVDDNDVPLFTIDDVKALGMKNALVIDRIFSACTRLNSLSDKAVDSEVKNFASEGSDSSLLPSPLRSSDAFPES